MCIETWLTNAIPDGNVDFRGFMTVRVGRDMKASRKSKGGRLIITTADVTPAMVLLRWRFAMLIWSCKSLHVVTL